MMLRIGRGLAPLLSHPPLPSRLASETGTLLLAEDGRALILE